MKESERFVKVLCKISESMKVQEDSRRFMKVLVKFGQSILRPKMTHLRYIKANMNTSLNVLRHIFVVKHFIGQM